MKTYIKNTLLILVAVSLISIWLQYPIPVSAWGGSAAGDQGYLSYSVIKVNEEAVFDYEFSVAQKVRVVGSEDKFWKDTVDAKVGDTVEFQIEYKNNSDKRQAGVAIKDTLPSNLRYVAGSTRLKNSTYKDGTKIREDYLVTDGLDIGNYGPGANALIRFYAEVVDDNLEEGGNNLINWVQVGVGDTTIQDFARVSVEIEHNIVHYVILAIYAIGIAICLVLILIVILMYRITKQSKINRLNHGQENRWL